VQINVQGFADCAALLIGYLIYRPLWKRYPYRTLWRTLCVVTFALIILDVFTLWIPGYPRAAPVHFIPRFVVALTLCVSGFAWSSFRRADLVAKKSRR
jgi:hypothetical protein